MGLSPLTSPCASALMFICSPSRTYLEVTACMGVFMINLLIVLSSSEKKWMAAMEGGHSAMSRSWPVQKYWPCKPPVSEVHLQIPWSCSSVVLLSTTMRDFVWEMHVNLEGEIKIKNYLFKTQTSFVTISCVSIRVFRLHICNFILLRVWITQLLNQLQSMLFH